MRCSILYLSLSFRFDVMCQSEDAEATNLFKVTLQSNARLEAHRRQPCPGRSINSRTTSSRFVQDFDTVSVESWTVRSCK